MCGILNISSSIQDITSDLIVERTQKLIEIIKDPTQITSSGHENCIKFFLDTVQYDYSLSSKVKNIVLSGFSVILEGDVYGYISSTLLMDVKKTIVNVISHYQQSLSVGEVDSPYVDGGGFDNLRVTTRREYYESVLDRRIPSALTSLEEALAITPSSSTLKSDQFIDPPIDRNDDTVGITLIQYARDLMGMRSILGDVRSVVGDSGVKSERNWTYVDVLYNFSNSQSIKSLNVIKTLVKTKAYTGELHITTGYESVITGHAYCGIELLPTPIICPESTFYVPCNGMAGLIEYTCSTYTREPVCGVVEAEIEPSSASLVPVCTLYGYSSDGISCMCSLNISDTAGSRRLSEEDPLSEVRLPVYTSVNSIRTPFTYTFTSTPPTPNPTAMPSSPDGVKISLTMSGLTKVEIDQSPALQLSLRIAMAETLNIELYAVESPIVTTRNAAKYLLNVFVELQSSSVSILMTVTHQMTLSSISSSFNSTTFTSSFVNTAVTNGFNASALVAVSITDVVMYDAPTASPTPAPSFYPTSIPTSTPTAPTPVPTYEPLPAETLQVIYAGVIIVFVLLVFFVLWQLEIIDFQKLCTCRRFRKIYVGEDSDNDDDIVAWKRNAEIKLKKEGAARVKTREQKQKEKDDKAHAEFMRQAYAKQLSKEAQEAEEAAAIAEAARIKAEEEEAIQQEVHSWARMLNERFQQATFETLQISRNSHKIHIDGDEGELTHRDDYDYDDKQHDELSQRLEQSSIYTAQSTFSLRPESVQALAEFEERVKVKEELRKMQFQKEKLALEMAAMEEANKKILEDQIASANAVQLLKEQEDLIQKEREEEERRRVAQLQQREKEKEAEKKRIAAQRKRNEEILLEKERKSREAALAVMDEEERRLEMIRLADEEADREEEEMLMQAEESYERKRLKEEKRLRLAAIAEIKRQRELAKLNTQVITSFVENSLLPASASAAMERFRERDERLSMEVEELKQREIEAKIALEVQREILMRIREQTILRTSKDIANSTIASTVNITAQHIAQDLKAAAELAAKRAEEDRLQRERDLKRQRQQEALETERLRLQALEEERLMKLAKAAADHATEQEQIRLENIRIKAERQYQEDLRRHFQDRASKIKDKEERQQILAEANALKQQEEDIKEKRQALIVEKTAKFLFNEILEISMRSSINKIDKLLKLAKTEENTDEMRFADAVNGLERHDNFVHEEIIEVGIKGMPVEVKAVMFQNDNNFNNQNVDLDLKSVEDVKEKMEQRTDISCINNDQTHPVSDSYTATVTPVHVTNITADYDLVKAKAKESAIQEIISAADTIAFKYMLSQNDLDEVNIEDEVIEDIEVIPRPRTSGSRQRRRHHRSKKSKFTVNSWISDQSASSVGDSSMDESTIYTMNTIQTTAAGDGSIDDRFLTSSSPNSKFSGIEIENQYDSSPSRLEELERRRLRKERKERRAKLKEQKKIIQNPSLFDNSGYNPYDDNSDESKIIQEKEKEINDQRSNH